MWKRMTLLSRWEVPNAPSHDGRAPHTNQRVSTRLSQVSLHEKAPRPPGFSMEEEWTPASASKSKFEGSLKGWKWCHNMKRILPWNFAIWIHVVKLCLYFFGQRDNCTWMLVQETPQIMGAPRQNCHLTQVDFKSYSKAGHQQHQVRAAGWLPAAGNTRIPHALQFITTTTATTLRLSEKWEILPCLLRNIKENRGNCLQFSSSKLIPSEHRKWGLNT